MLQQQQREQVQGMQQLGAVMICLQRKMICLLRRGLMALAQRCGGVLRCLLA
jgi:hypothetical protein